MKLKKTISHMGGELALLAAFAMCSVDASEVLFTGGSGNDLATGANWSGGACPGAGDVGVVDFSTYSGGTVFTVSSDTAMGGLCFTNATAAVTLSGEGTLSLGADGFSYDAAKTFTLRAPMAVTAAQEWKFALGDIESYATISGTDSLFITNCAVVSFREAPQFDGDLKLRAYGVRHFTRGKVARSFRADLASGGGDNQRCYNNIFFGGEMRWSDMFTSGSYDFTGWRRFFLGVTNLSASVPVVKMDSANDDLYQNGPYRVGVSAGILEQSAGKIRAKNRAYGFTVGVVNNEMETASRNHGELPAEYRLSGTGELDVGYVFVGAGSQKATYHPRMVQDGGTATVSKGLYVGGDSDSASPGFGEYIISNGTIAVGISNEGSDHQTRGIALCQPFGGAGTAPGVFTLAGGSVSAWAVKFGPDTGAWNATPPAVNQGFGLFEMKGGSLDLRATGFSLGAGWNKTATNAAYRINLSGGQVDFAAAQTVKTGLFFPPGGEGATLNTGNYDITVDAPISGDGVLRKTGNGYLVLMDANRFTGKLDVEAGAVDVRGTLAHADAPPASGDDCWTWTADHLTNDFAHGSTILSWADDAHGLAAVDWTNANSYAYQDGRNNYKGKLPTLATNNYFNGHASLHFNQACLMVPAVSNPLAGSTNFTMVVVFRPNNTTGDNNIWYGHTFFAGSDYEYGPDVPVFTYDASGCLRMGLITYPDGNTRKAPYVRSRSTKSLKNTVNVAVGTVQGLEFSLNVNGYLVSTNVSERYTSRPMFMARDKKMALCFGGQFPDWQNFRSSNQHIPEVRIYTRKLSVHEQNALIRELLRKYRGDAAGDAELLKEATDGLDGALNGESAPAAPVATSGEWTADALNDLLDDGATVASWPNADGTKTATAAIANAPGPKLVKDSMNGRSVLRFDGTQAIGIPAADSLVSGQANYTVAVVFRTTTDGTGANTFRWDRTTGLVSSKATTWNSEDFAISFGTEGTVGGFYGDLNGNSQQIWDRRPFRLHDGLPHVAVMSVTSEKKMWFMIDGQLRTATFTTGGGTARAARNVLIGAQADGLGYFTGDIAAVRLYPEALTSDQMKALSEHYAYEYGFRLLPMIAPGGMSAAANGLGATNIHVAAGATFKVPISADAPFAFTHGVGRLTGEGKFLGSYRYAAGSTLDAGAEMADVEDLQIVGATLRFPRGASLPWTPGSALSRVAGSITVDMSDWAGLRNNLPSNLTLAQFDPAVVDPAVTFTCEGLGGSSTLEYNAETGVLVMHTVSGTRILFK